jgi:hypothetical protein
LVYSMMAGQNGASRSALRIDKKAGQLCDYPDSALCIVRPEVGGGMASFLSSLGVTCDVRWAHEALLEEPDYLMYKQIMEDGAIPRQLLETDLLK